MSSFRRRRRRQHDTNIRPKNIRGRIKTSDIKMIVALSNEKIFLHGKYMKSLTT